MLRLFRSKISQFPLNSCKSLQKFFVALGLWRPVICEWYERSRRPRLSDYIIETTPAGELIFTIGRQTSAAPKLRYNLHDLGGVITHAQLKQKLASRGIDIFQLAKPQSHFPILFVYGRSDLTVPFYGAKVYPTDIEEIINADANLVRQINSFPDFQL